MTPKARTIGEYAAYAAAGVAALLLVFSAIWISISTYSPAPLMDQWDHLFVDEMLRDFFAQHNEHRIILSRVIFLVDAWLFRDLGVLPLVMVFVFQLAHAALWLVVLTKSYEIHGPYSRALLLATAAAFFFSAFQFENFVSGFQNQFTGVFLFAALAFGLLALHGVKGTNATLIGSAAAGVLAVCTMANGLLVVFLLPVLAWVLNLGWRKTAALAGLAAACWFLYFLGYERVSQHSNPIEGLRHLSDVIGFVLGYLGGAVPNSINEVSEGSVSAKIGRAQIIGAAGVVLTGLVVFDAWRTRKAHPGRLAAAAMLLFIGASAGITALGRAGMGEAAMLSNRYGTATAAFWTILAGWCIARVAAFPERTRLVARIAVASVFLSCIAVIVIATKPFAADAQALAYRKREAAVALASGARAPEALAQSYPNVPTLERAADRLRRDKLSLFSVPWTQLLGERIEVTTLTMCNAEFKSPKAIFAYDHATWRLWLTGHVPARWRTRVVAFVTESGQVAGFGMRHLREDPAPLYPLDRTGPPGWNGYVTLEAPARISAVMITDAGEPKCRASGEVALDPSHALIIADPADAGWKPVVATNPTFDAGWAINGGHPTVPKPEWVVDPYGSWNGSDERTGVLRWRIASPAGGLAIPLVTGPDSTGLSIVVRDVRNGDVLAQVDHPDGVLEWTLWRVPNTAGVPAIEIEARDAGGGWGQWLALGRPWSLSGPAAPSDSR